MLILSSLYNEGLLKRIYILFHGLPTLIADLEFTAKNGLAPIHLAGQIGSLECVKFFLEKGCSLNKTEKQKKEPCMDCYSHFVQLLLVSSRMRASNVH